MIIKRAISLLTATTLNPNNVWSGSAFEYLRGPSFVNIGLITPGTAGGLLATQYCGSMLIAEEFEIPFRAPTVDGPNSPQMGQDMFIQFGGVGGDRLVTQVRNPTGGTLVATCLAIIQPAGGGRRR
jgi:hypothetical protein